MKILKIVGIVFGLFIVAAIILGQIADKQDGPRQSIMLLNTSDAVKSVTFELYTKEDTLSDIWYVNEAIENKDYKIVRVPEGKYLVKIWDEDDYLYHSFDYAFQLPDPEKSNYELTRLDLAADKQFGIAELNALYSGNSFAESMSNAVGTNSSSIKIVATYDGSTPFLVGEHYTNRTFVNYYDDIPSSVGYGEMVYGLFAVEDSLSSLDAYGQFIEQISKKAN